MSDEQPTITEQPLYVELRMPGFKSKLGRVLEVGEVISVQELGLMKRDAKGKFTGEINRVALENNARRGVMLIKTPADYQAYKSSGPTDESNAAFLDPDSPIIFGIKGIPENLHPKIGEDGATRDYGTQMDEANTDPGKHQITDAQPAGHETPIPTEALTPTAPPPVVIPPPPTADGIQVPIPEEKREGFSPSEYWENAAKPKKGNGRICNHCGKKQPSKTKLFRCCPDK